MGRRKPNVINAGLSRKRPYAKGGKIAKSSKKYSV